MAEHRRKEREREKEREAENARSFRLHAALQEAFPAREKEGEKVKKNERAQERQAENNQSCRLLPHLPPTPPSAAPSPTTPPLSTLPMLPSPYRPPRPPPPRGLLRPFIPLKARPPPLGTLRPFLPIPTPAPPPFLPATPAFPDVISTALPPVPKTPPLSNRLLVVSTALPPVPMTPPLSNRLLVALEEFSQPGFEASNGVPARGSRQPMARGTVAEVLQDLDSEQQHGFTFVPRDPPTAARGRRSCTKNL